MALTKDEGPRCDTIPALLWHCSRTPFYHPNPCTPAPLAYKRGGQNCKWGEANTISKKNITTSLNHTRSHFHQPLPAHHHNQRPGTRFLSRSKLVPPTTSPHGHIEHLLELDVGHPTCLNQYNPCVSKPNHPDQMLDIPKFSCQRYQTLTVCAPSRGTSCVTPPPGILLIATSVDGEDRLVPLAFALFESENIDS
jgi:hypothetical protein